MRIPVLIPALLLSFFAGCASTGYQGNVPASFPSTANPYPELESQIDHFLADTLFPPSNAGILIYSLTRREVLYAHNPDLLFAPASNQKLVTAAAALELLDPGYRFATDVFIDSLNEHGVIIRGSGDPLLSSADIDSIAGIIAGKISRSVSWNLVADLSCFDDVPKGKGWMWDDDLYLAPISPLSVNGNSVEVSVTPGSMEGEPARATITEPTDYVILENLVTTSRVGSGDSLIFERSAEDTLDRILINGTIAPDRKESSTEVAVSNPEAYFLALLSERLEERGFAIGNRTIGIAGKDAVPSFTYERDLDSVLHVLLKESDNLCAENLFRILGRSVTGLPGSNEGGILAVKTALDQFGIDTSKVVTADGSGISRYNLLTATTLVRILEAVYDRKPLFDRLLAALPIAGVDGTLSSRMKGTSAEGNLRAKTGTLRGASSLSGYVTTADGEVLAFSMLMQNFSTGPRSYRVVQDSIGVFFSKLRRSAF